MAKVDAGADFRARAAEARREAEKAKTQDIAAEFLKLAELWDRLAEKAEKERPPNS